MVGKSRNVKDKQIWMAGWSYGPFHLSAGLLWVSPLLGSFSSSTKWNSNNSHLEVLSLGTYYI